MTTAPIRYLLLAAMLFAASGCETRALHRSEAEAGVVALDRQILVMIGESALRRYRPGSAAGPVYGGALTPARQMQIAREIAQEYELRLLSDWPMPALGVRCFLAEVAPPRLPSEIVLRIAADPRVESVQAVHTFHTLAHNDPYYPLQTSASVLRLDDLHRMATGRHVTIAQIDSGVELEHPDLRGQLSDAVDFVNLGRYVAEMHGTAVAGIIVAKADNGFGIVGIAPDSTLMPLRACWQGGPATSDALCSSFTLAKAIQFALAHRARVLNLSLAGPPDPLLQRLVDKAVERGVIVVSALDPNAPLESFPALSPNVIAVASAGAAGGPVQAIYAPGEQILTTTLNAGFAFVSGSSFAAAHVSGIVALLLESSPGLKPNDVSALLHRYAGESSASGRGLSVDACLALASLSANRTCGCCSEVATPPAPRRVGSPQS